MCLIALAWKVAPDRPLLLIANRDEFHERPAAPLSFWADAPDICAGRDLREGGTWLGVHRSGRLAAVTNVREPQDGQRFERSRGALTSAFLQSREPARAFAERLHADAPRYGGFNLLLWDGRELVYASNRPQTRAQTVAPGIHGLSNAQLDTPWPKVQRAKRRLEAWLAGGEADSEALFEAMSDREPPADAELPDTGVGLEAERVLAPPFIYRPGYGTRCTTWVQIAAGEVTMRERRYTSRGETDAETVERFRLWR